MIELKGKFTTAKVMIDDVELECMSQITNFVNHPAFINPVAIMPDCHAGKGSVIGFTMPLTEKVIPNVVGVDISCGMRSIRIGKELPLSLEDLDEKIRGVVPFGTKTHKRSIINVERNFPWSRATHLAIDFTKEYNKKFGTSFKPPVYDYKWFMKKVKDIGANLARVNNSIGTLGGGNHFIETGIDDNGEYWITVHTGSRNFGKCICDYHQKKAIDILRVQKKNIYDNEIEEIKKIYSGEQIKIEMDNLKSELGMDYTIDMKGCEWLEGQDAMDYLYDMIFAQVYAEVNRDVIISRILKVLDIEKPLEEIETVHNFIDFNDFVIRKGSIRSYKGEKMIIPFNMRDGILVCEGKSNPEWNYSAPHGAGRVMSRSKAKKEIDIDKFKEQMNGIYSTSVCNGTLDEAPDAYKDAKIIEDAIEPTATIINRIKPVHNMKDSYTGRKFSK